MAIVIRSPGTRQLTGIELMGHMFATTCTLVGPSRSSCRVASSTGSRWPVTACASSQPARPTSRTYTIPRGLGSASSCLTGSNRPVRALRPYEGAGELVRSIGSGDLPGFLLGGPVSAGMLYLSEARSPTE